MLQDPGKPSDPGVTGYRFFLRFIKIRPQRLAGGKEENMWDVIVKAASTTLALMSSSAAYLVVGFALGGMMKEFISTEWLTKYLGRRGFMPIAIASTFGAAVPS